MNEKPIIIDNANFIHQEEITEIILLQNEQYIFWMVFIYYIKLIEYDNDICKVYSLNGGEIMYSQTLYIPSSTTCYPCFESQLYFISSFVLNWLLSLLWPCNGSS